MDVPLAERIGGVGRRTRNDVARTAHVWRKHWASRGVSARGVAGDRDRLPHGPRRRSVARSYDACDVRAVDAVARASNQPRCARRFALCAGRAVLVLRWRGCVGEGADHAVCCGNCGIGLRGGTARLALSVAIAPDHWRCCARGARVTVVVSRDARSGLGDAEGSVRQGNRAAREGRRGGSRRTAGLLLGHAGCVLLSGFADHGACVRANGDARVCGESGGKRCGILRAHAHALYECAWTRRGSVPLLLAGADMARV